ncbi:MAG TPA: hypothetical protein P5121_32880 [Caldilineaceae bacterium]|nr:hypothetical protein [Caldilineaceae bacterium]
MEHYPSGLQTTVNFPLVEALLGRRSRRFALGATLPDGPLAFTSRHEPHPLSELEKMLVLSAAAGNTGWHHMINRREGAQGLPGYAAVAGGRTFPAGAGWHSSELFFTDDIGVYLFETRDQPALVERAEDGSIELAEMLAAHRQCIRKLSDGRLKLPAEPPFVARHNTWCANLPGSLLLIPVTDVSLLLLTFLSYMAQNGACIYDNVHGEQIAGIERFRHLVDVDNPAPLTEFELSAFSFSTIEMANSCYAGMLMLQAMGLGGWIYTGMNGLAVLGASGKAEVPGLGFRYDTDDRWPTPNVTGLPGIFEAHCPPHYPDMRAAVEALAAQKFGNSGSYHAETPGPWKTTSAVRGSAQAYSEEFKECIALMAQHIYDRFGKFPGTVPSIRVETYLQAHHLDLEFYDEHFNPGAYLWTHAQHMADWHSGE